MSGRTSGPAPRHIVVADEDRAVVAFIVKTLREDGHAVFHAYDVLAATQLAHALVPCDLVLSNTKVEGADGVELVVQLRKQRPAVPIIYLANDGRSTPEIERQSASRCTYTPGAVHGREAAGGGECDARRQGDVGGPLHLHRVNFPLRPCRPKLPTTDRRTTRSSRFAGFPASNCRSDRRAPPPILPHPSDPGRSSAGGAVPSGQTLGTTS